MKTNENRGLFFEEYEIGLHLVTMGKTINESDVMGFAGLTGDFSTIHTDAVYAANFHFGQRIAHGLLGLSTAVGLAVRMGFLEGTVLAFREIMDWKFCAPIYFGDTIHAVIEVTSVKAVPKLGGGLVVLRVEILNQNDKIVQQGKWSALIKRSPSD